jgi:hypothetical protein
MARAQAALGQEEEARQAYRRLLQQWAEADQGIPALLEVRQGASPGHQP